MMWMIQPRVPAEPIQVKPPRIIHSSPRRNLPLYIWPSPGSRKLRMAAVPALRIGSLVVAVEKLAAGPQRPAESSTPPPRRKFQCLLRAPAGVLGAYAVRDHIAPDNLSTPPSRSSHDPAKNPRPR